MLNMMFSRRCLLGGTAAVLLPGATTADISTGPQPGDGFVMVDDTSQTLLQSDAIRRAAPPVMAWPVQQHTRRVRDGARFNQVLLLRVADDQLVAFSAICPHAGCIVSEWIAQPGLLLCPCHGSQYDPRKAGQVVVGPSPLSLPALPLAVIDRFVVVAGPFSARPGGHASRTM